MLDGDSGGGGNGLKEAGEGGDGGVSVIGGSEWGEGKVSRPWDVVGRVGVGEEIGALFSENWDEVVVGVGGLSGG